MDVTKIKAGKLDLNFEIVSINHLVDDVIHDLSSTIGSHRIIKIGGIISKVRCDENRIKQVLNNLLTNAVKYSMAAEKEVVTVSEDDRNIQVDIHDFGMGIAKENLPKVFDRFFRAHGTDSGMLSSLGLGLYISTDIIKRHSGKIWVESVVGQVQPFIFYCR